MDGIRALGAGAVLLIVVGLGGILATLVTSNELFTGSGLEVASLVTLVAFVVAIVAFVAIGRPWDEWGRTAYW